MVTQPEPDFDLINSFTHDLKTPLSSIKSFIELVPEAGDLNDQQRYFYERALAGVAKMQAMIDEVLDFARMEAETEQQIAANTQACDLAALVQEAHALIADSARQRDIRITFDIAPRLPPVRGVPHLLRLVFNNLLSNALKYNRDGGDIHLSLRDERGFVRVDVRDTGQGIRPEDLPHVFERFFRAKHKGQKRIEGTGLGLAIARSIVEHHGGHIWATSIPDEGSTFSFTLPHTTDAAQADHSHRESEDRPSTTSPTRIAGQEAPPPHYESAAESDDDFDDNLQESPDRSESDSNAEDV